ncbi:MAG TPA: ATP-binding protein [Gemmatimonadaceae bacterium]|nr:ATP-binding protein [Gemmatimonadaceae bacterium]
MIRVVLTGSESTGKTTLAEQLARHYGAELVPEFVRAYAERKGGEIEFSDHGPIARGQMALEDEHIARAGRLVVQDTDLLSTVVYCNHYFGGCPPWIDEAAAARRPDLYLLCEIDLDWIADGVRDRGHLRDEMQQLFREAVHASGVAAVAITGTGNERLERAIDAIDALLLMGTD